MVVLEAMSSGVPVVATDVGGVRELLAPDADDPAGLVVMPRNPDAIARGMLTLAESPKLMEAMGRNGRRRVRDRFSVDACTEKHLRVYSRVLGAKSGRTHC